MTQEGDREPPPGRIYRKPSVPACLLSYHGSSSMGSTLPPVRVGTFMWLTHNPNV